jgi:glycosyltransferase involved in cell wall biosynthesis
MSDILLSIIIATKNRVRYCIDAIETTLSLPDEDIELVVQDNTDNKELEDYIKQRPHDKRLKYHYTSPPFSSIDNFNAAVELATGEYLCMIGDDDAVLPEITRIVRWAKENNIDSICSKHINYFWPDAIPKYPGGLLVLSEFSGKKHKIDTNKTIKCLLKNGIMSYLRFNLPKLYHGLVKKKYMDEIKSITGHYFGGLSPDIYSAIGLSFLVKNHIILDYPLTIAGACVKSTTVDGQTGRHSGKYEDAPHLRDRENYVWDSMIPKFYSVETIWAETGITAIKEMNRQNYLKYFNIFKFFVYAIHNNKTIRNLIFRELNLYRVNNKIPKAIFMILFVWTYLITGAAAILKIPVKKLFTKNTLITENIENIQKVVRYINIRSLK